MSQKTLNLCLERYNFVKFGETTKSSHTVLCINNAYSVNSDKYRLTPTAIADKHDDGYVFTLNYDFDRPLFTIVQKSYTLDGTSGNIVFEGIDPISKGGSKYLRKVTVSPVKLSDGSYLLEVTNDEYLRIGTTGAALGDEDLESLNEKIVATGGIGKSVETVGGKQVLKLDAGGPSGAKEIVYFEIDPSNPPSGIYDNITVALSNDKEPVIRIDGAVYFYTSTGTDKYVFVGGYTKEAVGYTEIEVSDDDSVTSKSVNDKVFNMFLLYKTDPASPGDPPGAKDYWICDENKHVITKAELLAAHADCRYFILNNAVEPDSNSRKYFASVTDISNSYIRLQFYMTQSDDGSAAEVVEKIVSEDSEGRLYISSSFEIYLAGTNQAVLVSEPQSFNATQKAQGRDNIGAASASDVTALQSQVSSLSDVSAYSVKGEATVAQLNAGPSGIQAGWAYQLTDSGTLTDGTLAVVAGDTVAWDGTKWFPLVKSDYYATKTYAQNLAAMEKFGFAPNAGMTLSGGVGSTVDNYAHSSNGYDYYETACSSGDTFVVVGVGGDGLRLWAFLDSSRKILSVASAHASATGGVILEAQADGFLCVNCTSGNGRVFKIADNVTKNTDKTFIRNYAELGRLDILDVVDGSINTNVGFGNVVTLIPNTSALYVSQVVNVSKGDRFFVSGRCGTNPRLWAFVDSSDKIVSVYNGNETDGMTEREIVAPFDGKLIVNFAKNYPYTLAKIDLQAYIAKREKFPAEITERIDDVSAVDLTNWGLNASYATNGDIGSTVNLSPTQSNTCRSLVADCKAGDKFVVKGTGATNPRLWCFVDVSNKIVSHSDANASAPGGIELVAKTDGKLIVNVVNSSTVFSVISFISNRVYPVLSKAVDDCKTLSLVQKNDWVNECYIKTNLGYGNVVSLTPVSSTSFRHMVVDCKAGESFYVKANGGEAPRSWTFVDSDNKIVSSILNAGAQSELIKLYAPVDGKLIVNDSMTIPKGVVLVPNAEVKQEMLYNLDARVKSIEDELPPNTIFEIGHDLPDVSSYIEDFDYSTTAAEKTILEQVYAAFDDLVTDYPDYVSKVDAAEEVDIAYPEYANGYDGVPAYKMYMYKFVSSFVGAGNENGVNPKKKMFIVAGTHGNETAAPVNAYIFAKKLCEALEANFFKLRTCYDVYIIPCVNGFGLYKLTRVNANGVDINRNYPIEHWHVTGQPGEDNYSGASAGSEFETQVVCAIFESLNPDIAIDHHNYSDGAGGQFYMTGAQNFLTKIAYQFMEDCSFAFIKNLPEYFGTAYKLFKNDVAVNLPAAVANPNDATTEMWFAENGADCTMTVEMSNCINYYGGEAVSTGQGKDVYGATAFSIGQYTLAGILFKVAGYIVGK